MTAVLTWLLPRQSSSLTGLTAFQASTSGAAVQIVA
jgi:uncharacterized membrane protein AbrB (regulator of aidB expression)